MTIFSECFHLKGKVSFFSWAQRLFLFFLSFCFFLPSFLVCVCVYVSMPFPAGIASICYLTLLDLTPKLVPLWSSQSFSALYSFCGKLLLPLDLGINSRMRFSALAHYQKRQVLSAPLSVHWTLPLVEGLLSHFIRTNSGALHLEHLGWDHDLLHFSDDKTEIPSRNNVPQHMVN